MKKRIKRYIALLLSLTLVLAGVLPVSAENQKETYIIGQMTVWSNNCGEKTVPAALYGEELILLEPETIAEIAGMSLSVEKDAYIFRRENYIVQVNAETKTVDIGTAVGDPQRNYFDRMQDRDQERPFEESEESVPAWKLYPEEKFQLEGIHKLKTRGKEKVFFPMEKMFYLLNVQWYCNDFCVYCYTPLETLWDVMGELRVLAENKPNVYEVIGTSAGDQFFNSWMFGFLAVGDDLKPWMVLPIFSDEGQKEKSLEPALLALAAPCANINGGLRAEAEQEASGFIGNLADFAGDLASVPGGADIAKFVGQDFSKWSSWLDVPEKLDGISVTKLVSGLISAEAAAFRYKDWTEGYVQELEDLSKIEHDNYKEYCGLLNKVAKKLYDEYGKPLKNMGKNAVESVTDWGVDTLLGMTPVGWVFSTYEGVAKTMKLLPGLAPFFQSGDYASDAMRLCDLACLLQDKYCDVIEEINGQPKKPEDLEEIRKWGKYFASASAHGYDSLYSALREMLIREMKRRAEEDYIDWKTVSEDEIESTVRSSSIMGKDMKDLASKLITNQTFVLRFQETAQFDELLMINDSFDNLYSDIEGAHREKIPPEYVMVLENNGGNVVRYGRNYYYWKYNAESFEKDGVFCYYTQMPDTVNQLICRNPEGEEKVLLNAAGYGPIYIMDGRIYLSKEYELFSVNLDGMDRVDHGLFSVWAADEGAGTILGVSYGQSEDGFLEDRGGVYTLNSEDYQITKVMEQGRDFNFIKAMDGYAYFDEVNYDTGWTVLYRMSLDGSETAELDRIEHTDDLFYTPSIRDVTLLNDTVYYCYGGYAGTGGFFQTGGINSVKADGSDKKTYVGDGEIAAEEFLVEEKDGEILLYYIGPGDEVGSYIGYWDDYPYNNGCDVRNLTTGETTQSDFKLSKMGSYVCMDGEISMIQEHSPTYDLVIPKEAAKKIDFIDQPTDTDKEINLISRLDVVGDELFFTVEKSIRNRERDFGWRPGYDRGGSTFYTMKIGDTKVRELYSY